MTTQPHTPDAPILHRCTRCGTLKPQSELNGFDPLTQNYDHAYCRRLAECNSTQVQGTMNGLLDALGGEAA